MTNTVTARACRTLATLSALGAVMAGCVSQPLHTGALAPQQSTDAPATSTTYAHGDAAFTVQSKSEAAARALVPALQSTAMRFTELFGDDAPRIVVMVEDASHPELRQSRGTSPLIISTNGVERRRALTAKAATSWVDAYANAWANTVEDGGYASRPIHGAVVPAWFQEAAVQTLANADASAQAARRMKQQLGKAPALASLFAAASTGRGSPLFVAQATSVLEFLRNEIGMDPTHDLLVPLLGGASMSEIMSHVDSRVSLDVLDATWRQWVAKGTGKVSVASAATVSRRRRPF
ncbi:MAG: hypothetical protein V4550_19000 [Gemmatimonadota bacterium]